MMATVDVTAESLPVMVEEVNKLALTAQRLERSASESERRGRQIREEESLQTAGEITKKAVGKVGPDGSVAVERLRQIARDFYGVRVREEEPAPRKGLSAKTAA